MPRIRPIDPDLLESVITRDDIERGVQILAATPDAGRGMLQQLFHEIRRGRGALDEVRQVHEQLRSLVETVDQPPWYPAILLRRVVGSGLPRAHVISGGQARVVGYADGVDPDSIRSGDEIYLSKDLHLIMARSRDGLPVAGETAAFDRYVGSERCVLRYRDEEIVADLAATLRDVRLERGDQVRWCRASWMAFEKLERASGEQYFADEVEEIDSDGIGGQREAFERIVAALTATLVDPQLAGTYDVPERSSILMEGPPGCGKTLMARAAAAHLRRISGRRCRFAVVKPGEWLSPWVGETEMNIRRTFRALADAARESCAILFIDEVESIGRIRGSAPTHHADAALACLLAELNGFRDRGNVAVIAATNRKDLVDPALLDRLSDVDIRVARPDLEGTRAIFGIHLREALPYADARHSLIDVAAARFFAPNADNELCTVRFRDNRSRTVRASELISGRLIAQICDAARRAAFHRHVRSGEAGLRIDDMNDAVAHAFQRLTTTLTRHNAHAYLADLPQDVDVLAVDPIVRRVPHPHRVLRAA